jgi:hypothetical protein
MSGQPYQNPTDPAKFRQQYLSNLALQANIDDMNLQANKVYKRTGAPSQPTDTRTTSERQADLYRLRIEIRSQLSEIADGANADKIVQALEDDQLRFLSDQLPFIVADIRPKYRTGVLAEVFIPYFEKYMDYYQKTKGVNEGLQQSSGEQILLNQNLILSTLFRREDLDDIQASLTELGVANTPIGRSIRRNMDDIRGVLEVLPEALQFTSSVDNAYIQQQIQATINDMVKDLPTRDELAGLVEDLARASGQNNSAGMEEVISRMNEITDAGGDIRAEIGILQQLIAQSKAETASAGRRGGDEGGGGGGGPSGSSIVRFSFTNKRGGTFRYIKPDTISPTGQPTKAVLDAYINDLAEQIPSLFFGTSRTAVVKNRASITQFLTDKDSTIKLELRRVMAEQRPTAVMAEVLPSSSSSKTAGEPVARAIDPEEGGSEGSGLRGGRIRGRGVVRPPDRPTKRSDVLVPYYDVDYSQGVKPTPRFVPFGRFVINRGRLDKDIIAVKRPSGGQISEFPSKRVSRKLGGVIRTMVGGKIPSFDDIKGLDGEEQEYLHFLASKADLIDKVNLPTPKKDDDEKDINQFEIMRGQIIAGNDSADMVKRFKQLIVKMSGKGLIPSRQVKDILIMLAENGY